MLNEIFTLGSLLAPEAYLGPTNRLSQLTITYSKLTTETVEQGVKYVQS